MPEITSPPESAPQRAPRLLWASVYCLQDTSSGAAIDALTMLRQLVRCGYEVQVLSATVFDHARGTAGLQGQQHLLQDTGSLAELHDAGFSHRLFVTRSTSRAAMCSAEESTWLALYSATLDQFKPDVVLYYGGQALDFHIAAEARARGIGVAFYVANALYVGTRWCRDVDLLLTNSHATAQWYRDLLGLTVLPLGPFIAAESVQAPARTPQHILFVNPVPEKGAAIVVRLAMLMEQRRPDIVFEVVESRGSWTDMLSALSSALGTPRTALANVRITPNTHDMRAVYGRIRLLLVPSLWREAMGRVIVEALLNGIPAIVSERGGMPEMVQDGGIVLRLPQQCYQEPFLALPADAALEPIIERLEALFDDAALYAALSERALAAGLRHDINVSTQRLLLALKPLVNRQAGDTDFAAALTALHRQSAKPPGSHDEPRPATPSVRSDESQNHRG